MRYRDERRGARGETKQHVWMKAKTSDFARATVKLSFLTLSFELLLAKLFFGCSYHWQRHGAAQIYVSFMIRSSDRARLRGPNHECMSGIASLRSPLGGI
jgi:hypothetical protein